MWGGEATKRPQASAVSLGLRKIFTVLEARGSGSALVSLLH